MGSSREKFFWALFCEPRISSQMKRFRSFKPLARTTPKSSPKSGRGLPNQASSRRSSTSCRFLSRRLIGRRPPNFSKSSKIGSRIIRYSTRSTVLMKMSSSRNRKSRIRDSKFRPTIYLTSANSSSISSTSISFLSRSSRRTGTTNRNTKLRLSSR